MGLSLELSDQQDMAAKLCGDEEDGSEEELDVVQICRTTKRKSLDLSHRKLEVIPSGVLKLSHIQVIQSFV